MPKYTKLTPKAKLQLADIFVVLEEKFIQYAQIDDVILVKPDLENNSIVCAVAKQENVIQSEFNPMMAQELAPYFKILRDDFTPEVAYKFITQVWDSEMYIKDYATIVTEQVLTKVKDPDYKPPKMKM